jgi:predicted membrane protein
MIIFTVLGILTSIFFFIVILISIIESRIKNRTKEKFLWNMEKLEPLTDKDLTNDIQNNER